MNQPRDYDTIVLNNGDRLRVVLLDITSREIRYRPYEQFDGPTRTISMNRISEIIHRDGSVEDIANKLIFGLSGDPLGFAFMGPEIGFELTKGNINAQVQARLPAMGNQYNLDSGFGVGIGLNYLLFDRHNTLYIGGIGEYENRKIGDTWYYNGVAMGSLGWRYVHDTGINIRVGVDLGGQFGNTDGEFVWRVVMPIGYSF